MNRRLQPSPANLSDGDEVDPAGDAEWRRVIVDVSGHGMRLDKQLVELAPEFSRSHLQSLVERGHVRLDGMPAARSSIKLRAGQSLELVLVPTDESRAFTPQAIDLAVLYEDEHLLVIDKPAGLVVHPAPGNWSGTLLNGLLAHHPGAASLPRAGIVHRLDKGTSGVMMVGKTLAAVSALVRAIAARDVHRNYLAIAHGSLREASTSIDKPIGRDPVSRLRMAVVAVARGGRAARTDVQAMARHEGFSALQCTLHSGRTHQIRVHLASIGHPLVADPTYGGREALAMKRPALHACRLRLAHPTSQASLTFEAPAPADFAAAWFELTERGAAWIEN